MIDVDHICLSKMCQDSQCKGCPILEREFAEDFQKILNDMNGVLKRDYGKYTKDHRDIIANTVEGILKGIEKFEGRSGAKFSTWAYSIFLNKTGDYLRKIYREKTDTASDSMYEGKDMDYLENEENRRKTDLKADIDSMIQILKSYVGSQKYDYCARLILDTLFYMRVGEPQHKLAAVYGLKENTFNKQKSRCVEKMGKLLRGKEDA